MTSHECFALGSAHVIIQRPAFGGRANCPWDGIAAGGFELRISNVVEASMADQEARSVFKALECVSALDQQKIAPETLFGSSFDETRQHSPLLRTSGLLAHRDSPSSVGYGSYLVEGIEECSVCGQRLVTRRITLLCVVGPTPTQGRTTSLMKMTSLYIQKVTRSSEHL